MSLMKANEWNLKVDKTEGLLADDGAIRKTSDSFGHGCSSLKEANLRLGSPVTTMFHAPSLTCFGWCAVAMP